MKAFEELRVKGIDVGFTKSSRYWISEKDLKDYLLKLRNAIDYYGGNEKLMKEIFDDEEKNLTTGQARAVMDFIDFLTKE